MRQIMSWTLIATLALALAASDAWAHGGQYRGPGGALPPRLREPSDPTPPAPPPESGAPVTPPTTTPRPSGDPAGPPTPPTGGSPVTPAPVTLGGRPAGLATVSPDSWVFWYEYNKELLQQLKRGIYTFVSTKNPMGMMGAGGSGAGSRTAARHATRDLVLRELIPALLWALDLKNAKHQDVESAAYIALAKVTSDPLHIELIQKGLKSKNPFTQESSALALGLLRRERTADQFDAAALDKVRDFLFAAFENEKLRPRARGFAALALGLLGDQPTGRDGYDGAAETTARLFELLKRKYTHADHNVALLVAISMQSRDSINDAQLGVLRTCVSKERLYKNVVSPFEASYAALALGRIGDKDLDTRLLLRVIGSGRTSDNVLRSSVISLGKLGKLASPQMRIDIAKALRHRIARKRIKDRTARNFAMISLAYLVEADLKSSRTGVLGDANIGPFLMKQVEDAPTEQRSYAALALGLICRAIGDTPTIHLNGEFQANAREALRGGLMSKAIGKRGRAAFAVALGLARDEMSMRNLTGIVGNEDEDDELRGYAAIALGHIGIGSRNVLKSIRKALTSRRSEKLRRATASALGMLHDRRAVPVLLAELESARSQSAKGQVVIALAKVGDDRAISPLIKRLKNTREQALTRALACAGLGIVGDLAWIPSLSRIGRDVNYRASGDMMNEVLSIL